MSIVAHSTTEQSRIPSGRKVELAALSSQLVGKSSWQDQTWEYPQAPTSGGVVETRHGCQIADPYRTLETLEDEATQKYIAEQNQVSWESGRVRSELIIALPPSPSFASSPKGA